MRRLLNTIKHTWWWGGLPAEYQEVEYIESSWTQRINTGIKPTQNHWFECKFNLTQTSGDWNIMMTSDSSYNYRFWYWGYNTQNWQVWDWVTQIRYNYTSNPPSPNTDYISLYNVNNSKKWNLNGVDVYTFPTIWTIPYSLTWNIFCQTLWNEWFFVRHWSFKLYYMKITEDTTLVRDFVPCYRKLDNVIWLYDLVNDVFYTNSGSWTFTKWQDVWWGWQPWVNTIAYYPLTSQTTVYDQSGNNNTLTEYHTAAPWTVSFWTYGWVDCCYINIWELSTNITSYTWPRTVLGWYQQIWQPNNDSSWIFGYGSNNTMWNWRWLLVNWKTQPATDKLCALAEATIIWNTSLSLNTWYFLALTLDWTRGVWAAKIYVNGQLDAQNETQLWSGAETTSVIWISWDGTTDRSMRGYVSNVIFEDKVRTAEEIADYYNQTKALYGIS